VQRDKIPQLAAEAAKQWTGTFNPREVSESDLAELYLGAF
jgi:alcohol dehydrogenase